MLAHSLGIGTRPSKYDNGSCGKSANTAARRSGSGTSSSSAVGPNHSDHLGSLPFLARALTESRNSSGTRGASPLTGGTAASTNTSLLGGCSIPFAIVGNSGPAPLCPTSNPISPRASWTAASTQPSHLPETAACLSEGTTTRFPRRRSSSATQVHVTGPTSGLCTRMNELIGPDSGAHGASGGYSSGSSIWFAHPARSLALAATSKCPSATSTANPTTSASLLVPWLLCCKPFANEPRGAQREKAQVRARGEPPSSGLSSILVEGSAAARP